MGSCTTTIIILPEVYFIKWFMLFLLILGCRQLKSGLQLPSDGRFLHMSILHLYRYCLICIPWWVRIFVWLMFAQLSCCHHVTKWTLHYFTKWKQAPIPFEEKTSSLFSLISQLLDHCTSVADVRVWVLFRPEFFTPFFLNSAQVASHNCEDH